MAKHDIVLIGASAGGVEAISRVVADLPRDLRAAVFVVLHIGRGRSMLPEILTRASRLPAEHPVDGEPIQYGRIYVAPPDNHMLLMGGRLRVTRTAAENGLRPAVDSLFRSAARAYGPRVIAVVLSGTLDDGTAGAAAVKLGGGVTIGQDPAEAFAPGMPTSAINAGFIDHVLPLRDIPVLVSALVDEDAHGHTDPDAPVLHAKEPDLEQPRTAIYGTDRPGHPSVFTCPACHGTLWEAHENGLVRFRCRVGHVYSPESMLSAQTDEVDRALWIALRTLEERAALSHRLAERGRDRGQVWVDAAFTRRAEESEREAALVREVLHARSTPAQTVPDDLPSDGPVLEDERRG
ncbi:MAG TPA: chemotaxis protein CheB [Vicinamibacterales bacterium]|jgi:two-component system chemotaxis response regulator CheB|nr:chemotaxis protein CheB [Vicinamibacterales bacterium]